MLWSSVHTKMFDVRDRSVIITGSAQGFGKEFAERLLADGAKVCLSDVNEEGGRKTLKEFQSKHAKDRVHFVK